MSKKTKKQKKQKDPNALSTARTYANVFFALKTMYKAAPIYIITYFVWSIGNGIIYFFASTWLLREIINGFQTGRSLRELVILAISMIALQFAWGIAIDALSTLVYPRYRINIDRKVREQLFDKAAAVELACYEDPAFYDKYVKVMNDATNRMWNIIYTVDNLIYCATAIITVGALIVVMDPIFLLFVPIPILFGLVRNKKNRIQKERHDKRQRLDRKEGYVQRSFYLSDYAKEMRLTGMPTLMLSVYKQALVDYIKLWRKYGFKAATLRTISDNGGNITSFLAMLFAAFKTLVTKTMLIGDCLVIFNSIGSIAWQITRFVTSFNDFREHGMYVEDYRYFLDYEPKIKSPENAKTAHAGDIHVDNVTFTYHGAEVPSVKNVDLTIHTGEKIALVGSNGSGKTTLVKLLMHLYEPDGGSITLDGVDMKEYDLDSYRSQYTVVFQDFKMFSISVAENVLLHEIGEGDEERVVDALKKSGAYDKIATLKDGIHTTMTREFDDAGAVLSVGETQKVSLARAFTSDAPIVILDEPSSALDPIAEYNMFKNMLEACEGRTLIFISHRLSSATLADRVFVMDAGEIIEQGSHAELIAQGGRYAEMFRMQAENYQENTESEVSENV